MSWISLLSDFWFIQISGFSLVNSIVISLASDATESEDTLDHPNDEQDKSGQAIISEKA